MRSYLPMAVIAVLVVVVIAAAFFLTPALAPPQVKLQEKIADKVAEAEAMLAAYSPSDAALLSNFDRSATSQPATASQPATDLDPQIRMALERRQNLIADALKTIHEAVNEHIEAGDASIGGEASVAATRLEALLMNEQAQVLRRQAAYQWRRASEARERLRAILARWTQLDTQVKSLQMTLSGQGELPSAESTAPAVAPGTETTTESAAPAVAAAPGEHSRVGQLLGHLFGPRRPTAAAPATQPAVAQAPAINAPPTQTKPAVEIATGPTTRPHRTPPPPDCTLAMPFDQWRDRETQSPAQRVADLRLCRGQVEQRLADAQKAQEFLSAQIQQMQQQLDAVKAQATAAQKKMLALEHDGIDATDPKSLPHFTNEYNDASTAYRRALRAISILSFGSAKEPQLSPDQKEMLSEPPVPLEQDVPAESRGITTLQSDLADAKGLVETQKKLLNQIDAQIDRLTKSGKQLEDRIAQLEADRKQQTGALTGAARDVVSAVVAAFNLEQEALNLLTTQGLKAAQRAEQAASKVVSQAQADSGTHPENPRLTLQMGDKFVIGGARTLAADMDATQAITLAQRMGGLECHAHMLAQIEPAGIPAASLVTEASSQTAPGAWATDAKTAQSIADKSREDAIKAAIAASDAYSDSKVHGDMKDLWTLQAQVAAMQYLLSSLTASPDAEKHLTQAKKAYELATRDRRDRPEVQPLRAVYEHLTPSK